MILLRKLPFLMALAGASFISPTYADEASDSALDDMVVTGTRSESPLLDLAGNTGKVSEKEIDLVRADHAEELLNRVSGVMLQRGNGQEQLTAIRSPILTGGAGAGSFLFMQDGIPLRAAGFANVNAMMETNWEQAGGIEVVRGPGSALYGSNAVNGLVNVLTRAPSLDLERSIDFSIGPHDLYKMKGTVSDTIGNQGYRLSVNAAHDGGYIADSGYDQQKMTFRHDYFGDKDSFKTVFSANNLDQQTAGYSEGYKVYENTPEVRNTNTAPGAYRHAKSGRLSVRWDHQLNSNSSFTITPYLRDTEMQFMMHWQPGTPIEKNQHQSVGVQTSFTHDIEGGHKVIVGTDVEYTQGSLSEVQTAPAKFGYLPGVHYDYNVDAIVIAPYIHTEWQLASKTRMTAGARFERTEYDYTNNTADGDFSKFLRPGDQTNVFNNFSPKLGLVQKLNQDTSAYINFAKGIRAPQTTDLYRLRTTQNGVAAKSEDTNSVELGVRKVRSGGFQYEVATYYMKKKNYFFRDASGNNVTNGRTRDYGVELSASVPLGEQFDLSGNYTYARHKFDFNNDGDLSKPETKISNGNDMPFAPRQIANVRLGWNFLPNSRAELEWMHIGKYYLDEANQHSYKGHDLFNLHTNYKFNKHLTFYGSITNLFNTKYAERADYNTAPSTSSPTYGYRYFVGEQRALHVGASYNF